MSQRRPAFGRFAAFSLLASLAGAAPAAAQLAYETPGSLPGLELELDRAPEQARIAVIADDGVGPRRLEVAAGERVAWRSASSGRVRIALDAGVARAMVCTRIVNFAVDGERLRSAWLEPGDIASFCELAPGGYAYTIERESGGVPERGEIVVLPRPVVEARAGL
jgi:hypothetical protein